MKKFLILILASALTLSLAGCATQDDVDKAYDKGHSVGYSEGYDLGYDDGFSVGYKKGVITERETPDTDYEKLKEQAAKATTSKMQEYSFANAPEEAKATGPAGYRYLSPETVGDTVPAGSEASDKLYEEETRTAAQHSNPLSDMGIDDETFEIVTQYVQDNPSEFCLYDERDLELSYESGLEDGEW